MNTTDKIMAMAIDYADWQEAKGFSHPATTEARQALRAEIEALARERDELMRLLKIVRGKHGAGILTLPPADLERFDAAMQEKQS